MGQVKNFLIDAEHAGADINRALQNFSAGMPREQAIATAMPTAEEREAEEWLFAGPRPDAF